MDFKERLNYIRRMENYYLVRIKGGRFSEGDVDGLVKDLFDKRFFKDDECKGLRTYIYKAICHNPYVQKMIAEKYDCERDEVCFYQYGIVKNNDDNIYKVAFGSIDYTKGSVYHTGPLKIVFGNAYFNSINIESIRDVEEVYGNLDLRNSSVEEVNNLRFVGGNLYLPNSASLKSLDSLEYVGGAIIFGDESEISFENLKYVGGELKNIKEKQCIALNGRFEENYNGKIYFMNEDDMFLE